VAFADPQSITIDGDTHTLPRVSSGENTGAFQQDDASVRMSVSHQYGPRTRRQIRVDFKKIAPDVFTSDNVEYSMSTYLVVDTPKTGFTPAEAKDVVDGLVAYLSGSSGARVTQLLGGEN